MCGAELDLSSLLEVLVGDGELTRDKFARLMCSSAKSHRRDYDIGDDGEIPEHWDDDENYFRFRVMTGDVTNTSMSRYPGLALG